MKLIAGLGNPGAPYRWTRHNFGFLALDFYFAQHHLTWSPKPRSGALTGQSGDLLFVKPQDFYNLSGRAIAALQRYYRLAPADVLVICDDFHLAFGTLRFRTHGSAGGNNGLKSVIAELGTMSFPRLRLGTANDALRQKIGDVDFVLSKFTPEEKAQLPTILAAAATQIDAFAAAPSPVDDSASEG